MWSSAVFKEMPTRRDIRDSEGQRKERELKERDLETIWSYTDPERMDREGKLKKRTEKPYGRRPSSKRCRHSGGGGHKRGHQGYIRGERKRTSQGQEEEEIKDSLKVLFATGLTWELVMGIWKIKYRV